MRFGSGFRVTGLGIRVNGLWGRVMMGLGVDNQYQEWSMYAYIGVCTFTYN